MPRPRTPSVAPVARTCVIGLLVGTALCPLLLALLGRGETPVPPVGFVTVAVFCWGLVPRLFVELIPARAVAPRPVAEIRD